MTNSPVRTNKWHFPRRELAQKYLTILDTGLTQIIALFARRRAGKTEFITHDLLPEAEKQGAFTYIVDFWANEDSPEECIVAGVLQTFHDLPINKKLKGQPLKEFKAGIAGISASIENPTISTINQAFGLMRQIHSRDTVKVVLFFDEIQHLATRPEFGKVASALRTFIDKNKTWLNVIFTGSSQDGLQRLFSQKRAAFYQSVSVLNFPLLGADYVQHTVNGFNEFTKCNIDINSALRVFKKVNGNPEKFSRLIQMLLRDKSGDIEACYTENEHDLTDEFDVITRWEALSDVDGSVLGLVVAMIDNKINYGLYSAPAFKRVKDETGLQVVAKSTIQNAIDRLRKNNWIFSKGRGVWGIEDESDIEFIRAQISE